MISMTAEYALRAVAWMAGAGRHGRGTRDIAELDIVQAVDPIRRIERCPLGRPQHEGRLCPLHRRLDQAVASVERAFAGTTIAELSAEAAEHEELCACARPDAAGPTTG